MRFPIRALKTSPTAGSLCAICPGIIISVDIIKIILYNNFMDNLLNKIIKIFLLIDFGIMIISIISIILLYFSFEIFKIPGIGVDFGFAILIFLVPIFIRLSYIEVIGGIIILIICFTRKKINYNISKEHFRYFIPYIFFLIYSIRLFLMYDLQNTVKIELLLNNIGIIIWFNILLYSNRNINKKYLIFYSSIVPLNCFLIYFILYQKMFGVI